MSSYFERNPSFLPLVERSAERALTDMADAIVRDARSDIAPHSSSAARAVRRDAARSTIEGPSVPVRIGRGLGNIFEFSRQQNRRLKGRGKYRAGTTRGVMPRRQFFNRNVDKHLALGMGRYLNRYI